MTTGCGVPADASAHGTTVHRDLQERLSSGCAPLVADVSFIGDTSDRSGNDHSVSLYGSATVSMDGLRVNGPGDWAAIPNFDYAGQCVLHVVLLV